MTSVHVLQRNIHCVLNMKKAVIKITIRNNIICESTKEVLSVVPTFNDRTLLAVLNHNLFLKFRSSCAELTIQVSLYTFSGKGNNFIYTSCPRTLMATDCCSVAQHT